MTRNPVKRLLLSALSRLLLKDPSWEEAQPLEFKGSVVESWKDHIKVSIAFNSLLQWKLTLPFGEFECFTLLFCPIDWTYNPYTNHQTLI